MALLGVLLLTSSALARPDVLLTLREGKDIYAGLKYGGVAGKVSLYSGSASMSEVGKDDDVWFTYGFYRKYWFSLSKEFVYEEFESGIEWLSGFSLSSPLRSNRNALGYYVEKEFGRMQVFIGPYLNLSYDKEDPSGTSEKNLFKLSPFLSLGVNLRI